MKHDEQRELEATRRLIELVEETNIDKGATWAGWGDAENITEALGTTDPGVRGRSILNRAILGEDSRDLLDAWENDIEASSVAA